MYFKKLLPFVLLTVLISCSKTGSNSSTSVAPAEDATSKKTQAPAFNASISASNCVYIGYGPECTDLTVTVPGNCEDYTYEWSSNTGNCESTPTVNVCPTCKTTYTVKITNSNGACVTVSKTVTPIDVRCGNKNDKVVVCHIPPGNPDNRHDICISPNAVQAHLDHGDKLGSCASCDCN